MQYAPKAFGQSGLRGAHRGLILSTLARNAIFGVYLSHLTGGHKGKSDIPPLQAVYCITVQGRVDPHWSEWSSGMTLSAGGPDTTALTGPVADQTALRGVLNRLWDLNLTLISVVRLPPAENP